MWQQEDAFLKQIIELAHLYGWICAHFRSVNTDKGWRTPVQADGAGFPDLVMVRERIIFAELKSDKGKVSDTQSEWLAALKVAAAEVYVWRLKDWEKIVDVLK